MRVPRPLLAAAYVVAVAFLLLPLLQAVVGAWPPRLGEAAWRFGAAGIASNTVLSVLMGLVLLVGLALWRGHRLALRGVAVLSGLAALGLVSASVVLGLDVLELRAFVRPEARPGFDLAALQLSAKLALAVLCTALVAVGGWRAAGTERLSTESKARRAAPSAVMPILAQRTQSGVES